MNCYKFENKVLNDKQLVDRIIELIDLNPLKFSRVQSIIYKKKTIKEEFDEFAKESEPVVKNEKHEYIGANKFITATHMFNGKRDGQLTPVVNEENRRKQYIKDHLHDFPGNTEAEKAEAARIAFNDQIHDELQNSKVGNYVHSLVHVLLEKGERSVEFGEEIKKLKKDLEANDYEFAKSITAEDKKVKYDETQKQCDYISGQAKKIYSWVKSAFPNADKYYSEMPMVLKSDKNTNFACIDVYENTDQTVDYKGIIGIADLIVLDKNGTVHIVDYKVSCRPTKEWVDAKKNEVDYQLCLYRAMLELNTGIDPAKVTLYIKPMLMNKQCISSLKSESELTSESYVDLLKSGAKGASRVAVSGRFSQNLRRYGIGSKVKIPKINDSELNKKIEEDWTKIMGYNEDLYILSKEDFINKEYLKIDTGPKGEIVGWKFFDKLSGKSGTWVKNKDKEAFTRPDGLIDDYLNRLTQNKNDVLKTIIQELTELKNKPTKDFTFLRSDNHPDRAALLQKYLGKYIDKNWEYVGESIPELAERGILLFQKNTTQGSVLEIVTLTDKDLNLKVLINDHQTILGKYYNDTEVNKLSIKPLISTYKNIKGLEALSVLNTIAEKYPDVFKDSALNKIVVLNPLGEVNPFINLAELKDDFDLLCQKASLKNQFINDKSGIKTAEPYESLMSDLQDVISQISEDSSLNNLLTKLDENKITIAEKRETVYRMLKEMEVKFPQISAFKDFESKRVYNTNDPVIVSYLLLSSMFNYLNGQNISYDGKISKYGINFNEIFQILQLPFTGMLSKTTNKGEKPVGLAGGLHITSPRTTPSATLQSLFAYYDTAFNSVRKNYIKQVNYIETITKEYIKNYHNNFSEFISADNIKMWEKLLTKDSEGKVNKNLILKNPWDNSDLNEIDKLFLKEILWEINKYTLKGITSELREWHYKLHAKEIDSLDVVLNAKHDETYFQLPLSRADGLLKKLKIKDFGYKKYFLAKLEELKDNHDPRQLHQERARLLNDLKHTEMYDKYDITQSQRNKIIESENNPYNFSFDLDYITADIAFNTIRKEYFDQALMLTETVVAIMHLKQQEEGVDMSSEISTLATQSKISISNQPIIDEDVQDLSKAAGALKKLNSTILLAFRPLQMLKELTFGQFTNYSRAWAMKYGSNKISYKSVFEANKMIWGLQLGKYGSAFAGKGSLADFTMCEAINKLYGIANEDLNRIVENSTAQRVGVMNNFSRWMYISNSAPDYFNRLTLFIAKMIEDGSLYAHELDESGNLIYDWKKDERFNVLAKIGLNNTSTDQTYIKLKMLYVKMCEEFEKGGEKLITWDSNLKRYVYGDITQAYTSDQRASVKEVSDMAYGYYDHETKSILNHSFFGLIFLQFQTFMSAKLNLWLKSPTNKGGNTAQGKYVPLVQNGEIMYRRIITDEGGNILKVDLIPESELTEDEKGVLLPQMVWEGDYVEGLLYSIGGMLYDIFHLNWKGLATDKQRLANVKLAMHDLLIGIIIFAILKWIWSNGTNKLSDVKPLERVFLRAANDVSPAALTNLSLNPSFMQTWSDLKRDGINMLFDDDKTLIDFMTNKFAAAKDFIYEDE